MAKRKSKRKAPKLTARGGFKVRSEPVVHISSDAPAPDAGDIIGLPPVHGRPILFAIARDAHTIFAGWNIDWRLVFEKGMPADRQVHLRLIGAGGVEQKRVTVEPMAAVHYLTIPSPHDSYRVEIGYFQPVDAWNCIAISDEIKLPPQGGAEIADVDLATIPFHLSFQRLADLFDGSDDTPLARVVSKFQKHVVGSSCCEPNESLPTERQILRKLDLSLALVAAEQRDFQKTDAEKLARRARARLQFTATSPLREFERERDS